MPKRMSCGILLFLFLSLILTPWAAAQRPKLPPSLTPGMQSTGGGATLEFLGQLGGAATAVDMQGSTAYVGVGPRLVVLDVSDPARPVQIGATDVLNDPDTGQAEPFSVVRQVCVRGDYAYVVAEARSGAPHVLIVDVSTPTAPLVVGSIGQYTPPDPIPDSPLLFVAHIALADDLLALSYGAGVDQLLGCPAPHDTYVALYDLADPAQPTLLSTIRPGSEASFTWFLDATRLGDTLYIATSRCCYGSPWIYDISDPTDPQFSGTVSASDDMIILDSRLVASSRYVFHIAPHSIAILDAANPAAPTRIAMLSLPDGVGAAQDAALTSDGQMLLVATPNFLLSIDVSDPSAPSVVGQRTGGGDDICIMGDDRAYLAADDELEILNISTPTSPAPLGAFHTMHAPQRLQSIGDGLALMCNGSSSLYVADLSDPTQPAILASCDVGAPIHDFAISEGYACLATQGRGMVMADISTAITPTVTWVSDAALWDVDFMQATVVDNLGVYVYLLAADHELYRFLSQDPNPVHWPVAGEFTLRQLAGRYVFVGSEFYTSDTEMNGQIEAYDLDGGDGPRIVATYPLDTGIDSLCVAGDRLYVHGSPDIYRTEGCGDADLQTLDISDPLHPVEVGRQSRGRISGQTIFSSAISFCSDYLLMPIIHILGHGNHTMRGAEGLLILDASDPAQPWLVGEQRFWRGSILAEIDDVLYTTDDARGLAAWRIVRAAPSPWRIEAEDSTIPGYTVIRYDGRASACQYVAIQGDWGVQATLPHTMDGVLWARIMDPNAITGTFEVRVSEDSCYLEQFALDDPSGAPVWNWQRVATLRGAGEPDILILSSNPSARLDCLLITDDPSFTPSEITPCNERRLWLPTITK